MRNQIQKIIQPRVLSDQVVTNHVDEQREPEVRFSEGGEGEMNANALESVNDTADEDALSETQRDLGLPRIRMPTLQEYLDEPNDIDLPKNRNVVEQNQQPQPPLLRCSTRQRVPNRCYYNNNFDTLLSDDEWSMHVSHCTVLLKSSKQEKNSFHKGDTQAEQINLLDDNLLNDFHPMAMAAKLENDTPKFHEYEWASL